MYVYIIVIRLYNTNISCDLSISSKHTHQKISKFWRKVAQLRFNVYNLNFPLKTSNKNYKISYVFYTFYLHRDREKYMKGMMRQNSCIRGNYIFFSRQ